MKNFKTILSLVLALTLALSCFTVFAADEDDANEIVTEFSDVNPSTTVGQAVTELAQRGIITGYPDGTFLPEGNITRAEFAVICVRMAGLASALPSDALTGFADMDNDDSYRWARPYVYAATNQGIINGFDDGTFRAGEPVTYEQAVAMLMRLLDYTEVCVAETERQQALNPNITWSAGYITMANSAGMLKGTNSNEVVRVQPVNRGNVAILANNARSVPRLIKSTDANGNIVWIPETTITSGTVIGSGSKGGSGGGGGGNGLAGSNIKTVRGYVTATYITSLDSASNELGRREITIGKNTYDISSKTFAKISLYDIIGRNVRVSYDEDEDEITDITITDDSNVTTIYSGLVNNGKENFILEIDDDGKIEYCTNYETGKSRTVSLNSYNVIFNGKYIEKFDAADLADPDSEFFFKNGTIELIDGGTNYRTAKITNYETYVVSRISTSTNTISFHYGASSMRFSAEGSSGEYYLFRRGTTAIEEVNQLSEWDVLNIIRSPENAPGTSVNITEVSRNSKTKQDVTGNGGYYDNVIEIGNLMYQYNYEYVNYDPDNFGSSADEKYDLKRGDTGVSIYLDFIGQIAAVAMGSSTGSATSWKYGYIKNVTQEKTDFKDSSYKIQFFIMDENGNEVHIGVKSNNLTVDGYSYRTDRDAILDYLAETAVQANSAYLSTNNVQNLSYQQPIRYKLNSSGLLNELDTVGENKSPSSDDLSCDSPYSGSREYSSTSSRFDDFSVGSSTKIFYIPDDRTSFDEYSYASSPTRAFVGSRSYHVEAYNIATAASSRERAGLILVYSTSDDNFFTYTSKFMIVTSVDTRDEDNLKLTGYVCGGSSGAVGYNSTTTLTLDDRAPLNVYDEIQPGDIVRYLTDSNTNKITNLELWLDADHPVQDEPASSLDEAIRNRTMVYNSTTVGDPESKDNIAAGFRLAYGTVTNLETADGYITVSPTLITDNIDMETDDTASSTNSVFRHKVGTGTRFFIYKNRREGAVYVPQEEGLAAISDYNEGNDDPSIVVTYTTGDTRGESRGGYMRLVYIIK